MAENEKMKAVICTAYGAPEVLQIQEVEIPSPKSSELLIKIQAVPVIAADRRMRGLDIPFPLLKLFFRLSMGWWKPRQPVLGYYLAGEVVETGRDVKNFQIGDKIVARTYPKRGTYTQYICLPEDGLICKKPENMSWEEGSAMLYGALNAIYFFNRTDIRRRKHSKTLVYGGSGAIGTAAIQLAKHFGSEVTAVCSTSSIDLVKSIGADKVHDYTKEDCKKLEERFDVVFDAVGKITAGESELMLKENGNYVSVFFNGNSKPLYEDMMFIKELSESEALKPVIDKIYPMEEAAEAHRHGDTWHAKGNVIISIKHDR